MTDASTVEFIIDINDPELDSERTQKFVQNLINQLRKLDGVERVERTQKPHPEEGARGFEFLVGLLTAEVNLKNLTTFLGFLGDRLGNKPIKVKVKYKEIELELEGSSQQELLTGKKSLEDLLKLAKENSDG